MRHLAKAVASLLAATTLLAPNAAAEEQVRFDDHAVVRVQIETMRDIRTLLAIGAGLAVVALVSLLPTGGTARRRYGSIALATLPIGIATWLVHLGFHLVTGWTTAEAAIHRVANDLGTVASVPDLILSCCAPPPDWLLPAELLVLGIGLAGSLGVAW